ncbi:MAG: hypothetical protein JWM40_2112 [Frankiales bacterium]|nr:hypothetical protein [Frankiales bacterium]
MKPILVALLLTAACGGASSPVASLTAPTATPTHTSTPVPPKSPGVHFTTPEAAMRYLATAWNHDDLASLKHVTDPAARDLLVGMKTEATNLSLDHCTLNKGVGDYTCVFNHDYPKGYQTDKLHGTAVFTVGPAARPGWYMTYFESCG